MRHKKNESAVQGAVCVYTRDTGRAQDVTERRIHASLNIISPLPSTALDQS